MKALGAILLIIGILSLIGGLASPTDSTSSVVIGGYVIKFGLIIGGIFLISKKKQALNDDLASTFVATDIKQLIEKNEKNGSSEIVENLEGIKKLDFKPEKEILLDLYNKQILTSEEYQLKMEQLSAKEHEIIEKIEIEEKEKIEKQNYELFVKELNKRTQPLITQIEVLKKMGVLNEVEFDNKKLKIENRYRHELENNIKNNNIIIGRKNDTQKHESNGKLYEKELKLSDGRLLQIIKDMGFSGLTEVLINDGNPEDGFYRLSNVEIAYEIENGKIKMEYYIEKFKQDDNSEIEVGGSRITGISKNSPVWLNGNAAPDGEYKKGLFSRIKVKNGRIV
jgi:hypothetical protein